MKSHRPPVYLTNSFISVSQLKSRIIMLQAKPTSRRALLGYALVLPLALGLLMCTQQGKEAERPAPEPTVSGEIFTVVEEQPEFPGGMANLGNYLGQNIKYPEAAQRANVSGRVFVTFIVTDKGEIGKVEILKGIGFGCDDEAVRVVRAMPRWKPGKQNGQPVNVKYNLPISFALDEKETAKEGKFGPPVTVDHVSMDGQPISNDTFKELGKNGRKFTIYKNKRGDSLMFRNL